VSRIAELVRHVVGEDRVTVETVPTDDHRSYHISSDKIRRALGYAPRYTVSDAIGDLVTAFRGGRLPDAMTSPRYYNIKVMQAAGLQ
jgi:nucleoside-diphosphate-sugar epimerase